VQNLSTEMKEIDFRLNQRVRRIVGISIMLAIAGMHAFRIGQYLNGNLYIYYYSFASDLILPIGSYFMLVMVDLFSSFNQTRKYVLYLIFRDFFLHLNSMPLILSEPPVHGSKISNDI